MDARGKQLMREWWTLKLAKEANEAEQKKHAHPDEKCE
jgi:hypothetical protein